MDVSGMLAWAGAPSEDDSIDLVARSPEPGIAGWKLCSNDNWHVTAQECAEAVSAYDRALSAGQDSAPLPTLAPGQDRAWDRWIEFLRIAAAFDGLRVS
jgi:hypothetical protein